MKRGTFTVIVEEPGSDGNQVRVIVLSHHEDDCKSVDDICVGPLDACFEAAATVMTNVTPRILFQTDDLADGVVPACA